MKLLFFFAFLIASVDSLATNPSSIRTACEVSPFEGAFGNQTIQLQAKLCKVDECEDVSLSELRTYDTCSVVNAKAAISQVNGLSGLMNDVAEGMVFQGLARNSHQQAVCRSEFFDEYERISHSR